MRLKLIVIPLALAAVLAGMYRAPAALAATYDMLFPVIGNVSYTDTFGAPRGGGRTHEGIDIMGKRFLPIIAVADGEVGWIFDELGGDCCAVEIRHDDGYRSWYIHLNNDTPGTDNGNWFGLAAGVEEGAPIHEGQLIGWMGDSGNAEGVSPHLHFELHNTSNTPINPYPHLKAATVVDEPVTMPSLPACDFDADGKGDSAVGAPGTPLAERDGAGWAAAISGGEDTIDASKTVAVEPSSQWGSAALGSSMACGDFNGDGESDLAFGAPMAGTATADDAGGVEILSSDSGVPSPDSWVDQDTPGVDGASESGDGFGTSVASGDFNGDGFDDLAIGAPGEALGVVDAAGAVSLLYGSADGVVPATTTVFTQNTSGIEGIAEAGDLFGSSLTAGDFNRDGKDDLAIGASGEGIGDLDNAGSVHIVFGTSTGLTSTGDQTFNQNTSGVPGIAEAGDSFANSIAAGDINQDGFVDLVVGASGEDLGSENAAGTALVLFGSSKKLRSLGAQAWDQNITGVIGLGEAGDGWASDVTTADVDLDGYDDLVVGIPGEDINTIADGGAIAVVLGGPTGLTGDADENWHQGSSGIAGSLEGGDRFGSSVWLIDLDGDGRSDLLAGAEGETVGDTVGAGGLHVLRGGGVGLTDNGNTVWNQSGLDGSNGPEHHFGAV